MYVEMKDICKQYGSFKASDHVSFGIEKGKLVALLGPSGSGKTTLLRMIAGLEMPNSGDIYIDGKRVNDVPASKRGIGFVFQNYALFRYMTVYDNVAFGLELQKVPKKEIKNRLTVCETLIYHLRARKETRWHSFAENLDYPDKSDEWLKYVNTRKENGKIQVLFRELVKRGETYEHSY